MLGDLISAGVKLLGGFMDRSASQDAREAQERQAAQNIALQKEFAQNGLRWKVEDAQRAGIHPLFALGANTTSFAPVSVGDVGRSSMADTMGSMGQDISRAISAGSTKDERTNVTSKVAEALQLKRLGLENDLLSARIAKERAQLAPAIPAIGPVPEADKPEERPVLHAGSQWKTHPWFSNAEDYEKRYGDAAQEVMGMGVNLPADLYWNLTQSQQFQNAVRAGRDAVAPYRRRQLERRYRTDNWIY